MTSYEEDYLIQSPRDIESALEESEAIYQTLVETAATVILVLSKDGHIRYFNKEAERVFGYTRKEVLGKSYFDLFLPVDWHERIKNLFANIIDGEIVQGFENPIITRHAKNRFFLWNSVAVQDIYGESCILGMGQDITERYLAENALRKSEERYHLFFDNLAVGVAVIVLDGTLTMCNKRLLNMFGYSRSEVENLNFTNFIEPSYREFIMQEFKSALQSGTIDQSGLELGAIHKNGSRFSIHVSNTILYESGEPIGFLSVIRDITKDKEAEKVVLEERNRAQKYLDIASAAIVVLDRTGRLSLINQKGSEILGIPIDEIIGMNWFDNFVPEDSRDETRKTFQELLEKSNNEVTLFEKPVITSTGEVRTIEWRNSIIQDSNGTAWGIISSGVDVTDKRKAEKNLQRSADTAMLYLDIMGHDIRNHLQAIVMGTDILSHYELGADAEPIFELIVDSVENSRKLIDKMQTTRDLLSAPMERVFLSEVLTKCVEKIKDLDETVNIHCDWDIENAYVYANKYLSVLFDNLLDNAIQYNNNKDRNIWVSLKEVGEKYVIRIDDDGQGIPDKRKESLFHPERRFGGVGIHQAKSIIERFSGSISVENRIEGNPNLGASFTICIPAFRLNMLIKKEEESFKDELVQDKVGRNKGKYK
ncbi:MAG: PAS domain S-box protein [Candidatus Thorarchaeota archaeon]